MVRKSTGFPYFILKFVCRYVCSIKNTRYMTLFILVHNGFQKFLPFHFAVYFGQLLKKFRIRKFKKFGWNNIFFNKSSLFLYNKLYGKKTLKICQHWFGLTNWRIIKDVLWMYVLRSMYYYIGTMHMYEYCTLAYTDSEYNDDKG